MVKRIIIVLSVLLILISLSNVAMATDNLNSYSQQASNFLNIGKNEFTSRNIQVNDITDVLMPLGRILTTIGVGIILCVAAVMGIKWVTAKPDEQAKLKEQLVGLAVAAVVVLGAYTIWSIALDIATKLE